jgi:zinc protease
VLWGSEHPYGSPVEGSQESSGKISLKEVSRWHQAAWHPKNVTFVVAGDVSRARITDELNKAFSAWSSASTAPAAEPAPALPTASPVRVVMVDRPRRSPGGDDRGPPLGRRQQP